LRHRQAELAAAVEGLTDAEEMGRRPGQAPEIIGAHLVKVTGRSGAGRDRVDKDEVAPAGDVVE
jgi:hypothetical protein